MEGDPRRVQLSFAVAALPPPQEVAHQLLWTDRRGDDCSLLIPSFFSPIFSSLLSSRSIKDKLGQLRRLWPHPLFSEDGLLFPRQHVSLHSQRSLNENAPFVFAGHECPLVDESPCARAEGGKIEIRVGCEIEVF